jgi:hypothetical protein
MGLGLSIQLTSVLNEVRSCNSIILSLQVLLYVCAGPWSKVEAACKKFLDNQYNFGIGINEIIELTGVSEEEAKSLVTVFSRNSSQQLVTIISNFFMLLTHVQNKWYCAANFVHTFGRLQHRETSR